MKILQGNYIIFILIILILASISLSSLGLSSWVYTKNSNVNSNILVIVTNWGFNPWEEGDTIIINDDGTISVNGGDPQPAEVYYGTSNEAYDHNAEVELQIVANDDGTLAIAVYNVKPETTWLSGNSGTVYFPDSIKVNGVSYPIVEIGSPVDFDSTRFILTTSYVTGVVIPEGYEIICDKAFYDCEFNTTCTFNFPSTIENIGNQVFNVPRNSTFTINYNGTRAQWNAISKPNNWKTGTGTLRVECSDGRLTF